MCKKLRFTKMANSNILKRCKLPKSKQLNQIFTY